MTTRTALLRAILSFTALSTGCSDPAAAPTDAGPRMDAPPVPSDARMDSPAPDVDSGVVIPPDDPGAADVRFEVSSVRDGRRAISPWIYGSNQIDVADLHGETIARFGGNRWTAYNWETNASNAGSDYLYQNDTYLGGGTEPGGAVRGPVEAMHGAGLAALVTVPIAGFVAADTAGPTDSAGADRATRFHPMVPAGGTLGGAPSLTDDRVYADEYADWIRRTLMPSGTVFFSLDNEPDLWSETHSEIHPEALTYAEIVERNVDFATAITTVVPEAVVFGPVNYGYAGYVNLQDAPDAAGRNFLEHYLGAMSAAETAAGRRLVDALDVHWYPEALGGGARITGDDVGDAAADARMMAPRSLWDPTYVEDSWITDCCSDGAIRLLPRLQDMIDARYPGTRIAMTEYNYGGGGHISGGVAQADVLGIFGREDVFAAMWWQLSSERAYVDAAFEMYRDFDGAGATFGGSAIAADSSDVAVASIYASVDSDPAAPHRMVLVAINRSSAPVTAGVRVEHTSRFTSARVFRLEAGTPAPVADGTIAITLTNAFTLDLPSRSVTTLELVP